MPLDAANPGAGTPGFGNDLSSRDADNNPCNPNPAIAQAKADLIRADIMANASALIVNLEAAIAMDRADNVTGLIYALRVSRAYWKAISSSAAELTAIEAERLSAFRQMGGPL